MCFDTILWIKAVIIYVADQSIKGISHLMDPFGNLLTTDDDKAKLLSEYFASVYTIDNGITPPFQSRLSPDILSINNIPISSLRVKQIISKLKSNSAAGLDQLPPIFYCNTASAIDFPLSVLFRSTLDLRDLPDKRRQAIITPKLKKSLWWVVGVHVSGVLRWRGAQSEKGYWVKGDVWWRIAGRSLSSLCPLGRFEMVTKWQSCIQFLGKIYMLWSACLYLLRGNNGRSSWNFGRLD